MKKLINVINTKVLQGSNRLRQNQSQQSQPVPAIQKIIQTLPNRKNKAKKRIKLTDFRFYTKQIAPFCLLARSNFECNQFSIVNNKKKKNQTKEVQPKAVQPKEIQSKLQKKVNFNSEQNCQKQQKKQQQQRCSFSVQLKQPIQSVVQQSPHQQTIHKLANTPQFTSSSQSYIPQQIRLRFNSLIQQINFQLNDLYFHKKNLYEQPAFQININFTLFLLLLFTIIVIVLISLQNSHVYSQDYKLNQQYGNVLLMLTISIITMLYFINIIYCYYQKYQYFSFDLQVMKRISSKLMIQNNNFFQLNQYTLTSDIQMTWILLKPAVIGKKLKTYKVQR